MADLTEYKESKRKVKLRREICILRSAIIICWWPFTFSNYICEVSMKMDSAWTGLAVMFLITIIFSVIGVTMFNYMGHENAISTLVVCFLILLGLKKCLK